MYTSVPLRSLSDLPARQLRDSKTHQVCVGSRNLCHATAKPSSKGILKRGVASRLKLSSTRERSWNEYRQSPINSRIRSSRRSPPGIWRVARGSSPKAMRPETYAIYSGSKPWSYGTFRNTPCSSTCDDGLRLFADTGITIRVRGARRLRSAQFSGGRNQFLHTALRYAHPARRFLDGEWWMRNVDLWLHAVSLSDYGTPLAAPNLLP